MPYKPAVHRPPGYRTVAEKKALHDKRRGSAGERGYDYKWHKARSAYLKEQPLCVRCKDIGRLVEARVVDHIKPHKGDTSLFWDVGNWQPLCKPCHDRKTVLEDGGFGR